MAAKEGRMQAECMRWFRNEYSGCGYIWGTFNEGLDVQTKISLGLLPGVSDLLGYKLPRPGLTGLEAKFPGESHNVKHVLRQAHFILDVCDTGWFFDNVAQFQSIVLGTGKGYEPSRVVEVLNRLKTASFVWNGNMFL